MGSGRDNDHAWTVVDQVTPAMIADFVAATGDDGKLHTDEIAAARAGYRGIIAHGLLTASLALAGLVKERGGRLVHCDFRLRGVVECGSRLDAEAKLTGVHTHEAEVRRSYDLNVSRSDGFVVVAGSVVIAE